MPKNKWDPEEWERRLRRMLWAQENGLEAIFNDFTSKSSIALAKYTPPKKGAVWYRNTSIEGAINKHLITLHEDLNAYLLSQSATAWNLAADKTDLLVKDFIKNIALSDVVKEGLFTRNLDALKTFQQRRVGDMNLSGRVWKVCGQAKENLELYLQSGVGTGRSATQISGDVRGLLQNPDKRFRRVRDPETGKLKPSRPMANYHPGQGVYRSSYQNALRMTRTETNMAYRLSDQERWKKLGFITGYEVKLSASHPVEDICDYMAGEYPKTFVFGGWHPSCRCYSIPVLASEDAFVEHLREDTLITGHVKNIPQKAKNYVTKHTEQFKNWTNPPYWLKDNFTLKNGKYVPRKKLKVVPA